MAFGSNNYVTLPGVKAGADLSAKQYHIVKFASTAGEVVAAGNGEGIGVLMNDPTDGQVAEVAVLGVVPVIAEASVSAGVAITSNSTGRAQATTTANNKVLGTNLQASTSNGDQITLVLTGFSNY